MTENPNASTPSSLYGDPGPEPAPAKAPSLMEQVVGIFTEPSALFSKLRLSPSWAPAFILILVVTLAAMMAWASKVDMAAATVHQMERTQEIFKIDIPASAIDDAVSKVEGKQPYVRSLLGGAFGTSFGMLVIALVIWGCAAMGTREGEEKPTFGQAFSVTCVQGLVTLPTMLLAGIMALIRPVGGLQVQQLSPLSLGYFITPESMWMRGLVGLADPLWIFSFLILAVGMKVALRSKDWAIGLCLGICLVFGGAFRFMGGMFQ